MENKKCPFCGGKEQERVNFYDHAILLTVGCANCGVELKRWIHQHPDGINNFTKIKEIMNEMIETWNRRVIDE